MISKSFIPEILFKQLENWNFYSTIYIIYTSAVHSSTLRGLNFLSTKSISTCQNIQMKKLAWPILLARLVTHHQNTSQHTPELSHSYPALAAEQEDLLS